VACTYNSDRDDNDSVANKESVPSTKEIDTEPGDNWIPNVKDISPAPSRPYNVEPSGGAESPISLDLTPNGGLQNHASLYYGPTATPPTTTI